MFGPSHFIPSYYDHFSNNQSWNDEANRPSSFNAHRSIRPLLPPQPQSSPVSPRQPHQMDPSLYPPSMSLMIHPEPTHICPSYDTIPRTPPNSLPPTYKPITPATETTLLLAHPPQYTSCASDCGGQCRCERETDRRVNIWILIMVGMNLLVWGTLIIGYAFEGWDIPDGDPFDGEIGMMPPY